MRGFVLVFFSLLILLDTNPVFSQQIVDGWYFPEHSQGYQWYQKYMVKGVIPKTDQELEERQFARGWGQGVIEDMYQVGIRMIEDGVPDHKIIKYLNTNQYTLDAIKQHLKKCKNTNGSQ